MKTGYHLAYPGESQSHFNRRRRRGDIDGAEAYHLYRFRWQIFGHVTYAHTEISRHKRLSILFAAIARSYRLSGLAFRDCVWARREEYGALQSAPHIHFIIAAIPKHIDLDEICRCIGREWRALGGGLYKITRYDSRLDGAGYIAKCAEQPNGQRIGGCELTFSPAALNRLRRTAERGV
jgi:hypothetical protein